MEKAEVAIIGGGLAGLAAGILFQRHGYQVVLIEKKKYPFQKVCGEYLSLESFEFLEWLGIDVNSGKYPIIDQFGLTIPSGLKFESKLPLGGVGISRFWLDFTLKNILESEGGKVLENTKADSVKRQNAHFQIFNGQELVAESKILLGATGRNKPRFLFEEKPKSRNFIGVKRHVLVTFPKNKIELHHFPGGYCGLSGVENDAYCLCYLLDENISKTEKGNLEKIEEKYLSQNPVLRQYFSDFEPITERVSTSGVMFSPRPLLDNGIFFLGDAAGMIPPLAGNGMSMALHSAVLAFETAEPFLLGKIDLEKAGKLYVKKWKDAFFLRLKMARQLQQIMENQYFTKITLQSFRIFPPLFSLAARLTHGQKIPVPASRK
jgi:flavin-dependent dehydrogenase